MFVCGARVAKVLAMALGLAAASWHSPLSAQDRSGPPSSDSAAAASANKRPTEKESPQKESAVGKRIMRLVQEHAGDVAVALRHLKTGEAFEYRSREPQGTASLIKLPIMIEAYRQADAGKVALDELIELHEEDKVPGSGILTLHFSAGMRLSLRDAIRLMIAYSDNTATNLVLDKISIPATGQTMQQWGYPETRVNAKVYRRDLSIDLPRSQRYGLGSTTAHDMVDLLAKLHAGELVSRDACQAMLAHLAACDDDLKFPALLPKGVKIAHKTGSVDKIRTDAGIIETPSGAVALCVLTENNRDTSWTEDNAGNRLCAEIAKVTYDYFSSRPSVSSPNLANQGAESGQGDALEIGASGRLVEALQRTLNARAEPSPNLDIDGDFGPATEKAVKAFQQSRQLEITGLVDSSTWKALGPLLMEDAPVAEPEVINGAELARKAPDDPNGPPHVTCKAWTIADAATGEVLWDDRGDVRLDIASTTKIMTALLVIRYCQAHPEALDETIVFSEQADATPGSTSGVRAGERVPVSELLYGLLLPSGNDASVAFAEHFGDRLGEASDADRPALERFVNAMNRTAEELGMSNTHFANPHGLTAAGHRSTCNDLVRLARAARELPLFKQIVSTRQHGSRLVGESGYQRNVKWENTNQLLPIEGYSGVKTGTTDAAGACLVSCGQRGDRELIVVVLGSAASAARYADTRNLYAWAWRQLDRQSAPRP